MAPFNGFIVFWPLVGVSNTCPHHAGSFRSILNTIYLDVFLCCHDQGRQVRMGQWIINNLEKNRIKVDTAAATNPSTQYLTAPSTCSRQFIWVREGIFSMYTYSQICPCWKEELDRWKKCTGDKTMPSIDLNNSSCETRQWYAQSNKLFANKNNNHRQSMRVCKVQSTPL